MAPAPGSPPVLNGNLAATVLSGDTIQFSLQDTGRVLFNLTFSLDLPTFATSCSAGFPLGADKKRPAQNMTLAAAAAACGAQSNCTAFTAGARVACDGAPLDALEAVPVWFAGPSAYNLKGMFTDGDPGFRTFARPDNGSAYLAAAVRLAPSAAVAPDERIVGLGQGGWSLDGPCPNGPQDGAAVVPVQRNGQTLNLQQRKFQVTIPFAASSSGYGFLFNMPGYGAVSVGAKGVGGMAWQAHAALSLDVWVRVLGRAAARPRCRLLVHCSPPQPLQVTGAAAGAGTSLASIYTQYADATGHAPPLRVEAMRFWQSRDRYKSSAITQGVAAQ